MEKYQKRSTTRRRKALAVVSLTEQRMASRAIADRLKIQPYEVPILRKEAAQLLGLPQWKISFLESGPRASHLLDQATVLLEERFPEKREITKEFLLDFIGEKYGSLDDYRNVGKLTLIGVQDWLESQNPKQYGWKKSFLKEVPRARELLAIADRLSKNTSPEKSIITKEFVAHLVLEEYGSLNKYPNLGPQTIAFARCWAENQNLGHPDWKKSFLEDVSRGRGLLKHAAWSFQRHFPTERNLTRDFLIDFALEKYEQLHMFRNIGRLTIASARRWAGNQRKSEL